MYEEWGRGGGGGHDTYLLMSCDWYSFDREDACMHTVVCLFIWWPTYLSMKISDTSALPMLSIVSDVTVLNTINPMN